MRTPQVAAMCLLCLASTAQAQDAISPETLNDIKRATVYVKVSAQGREGSGSGFVVHVDRDIALIVTNHHVIEPKVQMEAGPAPGFRVPPGWTPRLIETTLKNASVTLVIESGTKKERTFTAEVLAVDPQRDLAILRIKNVKDLPKPIDFSKPAKLSETMAVFSLGFPFGKVLATGKGNPAITVGKAAISSLRHNEDGELAVVQIDGSLNPGNSGGPIVDARGQLVGVAVATIRNSSGIGLTIPAAEVGKMLQGRLGTHHLSASPPADGQTNVRVDFAVIDPLRKISSIDFYYLPASEIRDSTKKIESLEKEPGAKKITLAIDKQLASAELKLEGDAKGTELLLQAVYANEAGKNQTTKVIRQRAGGTVALKGKLPPRPAKEVVAPDGATKIMGGALRDVVFKDEAPDGGLLIGLEIGFGTFATKESINAVRPIYRTKTGEAFGKQYGGNLPKMITVKAKDGYAIGGVTIQASLPVFGLSVNFMRVKDGSLDPDDSYQSKWLGSQEIGRLKILGGDGTPIVGIVGKTGSRGDCSGLGMLLKRSAK